MTPLGKNVVVKKETPLYSGVIINVTSDESTLARVLSIGAEVTMVELNDKLLVDWRQAKSIGGDAYVVSENDIIAVLE